MKYLTVKINGKWPVKMPEHRANRDEWYTKEGWERKRLDYMSQQISEGDVVYYIGAELGEMPALCQMWGARVALFEPNHLCWPVIRAVWRQNKLGRPYFVFAGFCSNKTQLNPVNPDERLEDKWLVDDDGWPLFSREKIELEHGFSELYQEADGLPQIKVDDLELDPPTVLVIDVEGSEFEVLRGAETTIDKYKPKIFLSLHPEFLFKDWGEYSGDLRNWLKDKGYKETLIDYRHEVHFYYE